MDRPAPDGPAWAPISNSPRSWSLVELGARRNAAPRSSAMPVDRGEAEDLAVEGDAGLDVADEEDGVVEAADRHGCSQACGG